MKKIISRILGLITFLAAETTGVNPVYGKTNVSIPDDYKGIRYLGSVVELKGKKEKQYRELHANVWKEVLVAIEKANIRNYHIYTAELGGTKYLFSFFEYHGTDMAKDFDGMGDDAVTRDKWWPITDGCQERIPGTPEGSQWLNMESLMHVK